PGVGLVGDLVDKLGSVSEEKALKASFQAVGLGGLGMEIATIGWDARTAGHIAANAYPRLAHIRRGIRQGGPPGLAVLFARPAPASPGGMAGDRLPSSDIHLPPPMTVPTVIKVQRPTEHLPTADLSCRRAVPGPVTRPARRSARCAPGRSPARPARTDHRI